MGIQVETVSEFSEKIKENKKVLLCCDEIPLAKQHIFYDKFNKKWKDYIKGECAISSYAIVLSIVEPIEGLKCIISY